MEKKQHTIVVYDENYNIERKIKTTKRGTGLYTDITPYVIGCVVLLIMTTMLGGDRNRWRSESKLLSANMAKIEKENKLLRDSYDSLLIKEEMYQVHYWIGKYSVQQNTEIEKDSLCSFLEECGIWYPEIMFAQIVQESTTGKFVPDGNSNNLIGMKFPTRRETTAYGKTDSGYAMYKNWQLCVLDKILWDYAVFGYKKPSREEYMSKLRVYAEDPDYIAKIENIAKTQYKKQ